VKYLIWTYNYSHASSGPKVLHLLCHELNGAGQDAYVSFAVTNPAWNTPYHPGPIDDDWIAVYPEVVHGNPWNARHVVRWVLNNPGKLGGDKTYHPAEVVFTYHELFNDMGVPPERVLFLPAIETEIYVDRHLPRGGPAFYVGKGRKTRDIPGAIEITRQMTFDREQVADTLNRASVLYTFDNMTAMVDIARLCGCPAVVIPNGEYTMEQYDRRVGWEGLGWDEVPPPFDSDAFRARYLALKDTFDVQIETFIRITQGMA
jgi:hypothetical protein